MKSSTTIILAIAVCITATSCRSHYAASSEQAYQESINAVKTVMGNDGYTLASQSISNGYHDKETYSFSNAAGETVQFSYEVHRGEHNGNVFIDEVNVTGCSTSYAQNYSRYCGSDGIPNKVMNESLQKDVRGSKFSAGKTVGAVIGGSFALGLLIGLLEAAAMGLL